MKPHIELRDRWISEIDAILNKDNFAKRMVMVNDFMWEVLGFNNDTSSRPFGMDAIANLVAFSLVVGKDMAMDNPISWVKIFKNNLKDLDNLSGWLEAQG